MVSTSSLYYVHLLISDSNRKPSSPTVKWSAIQSVFEECACDVLFLLNCCAAAGATPDSGQGVIETIAACGFETWAPGPGRHSFTNALIEVLDDWMAKPSFSVAMLHSEMLSVIKHDRPERRRWADVNKVESRKTPIYILTSIDPKSNSIELSVRPLPGVSVSACTTSSSGKPRKSTAPNASIPSRHDIFDLSQLNSTLPSGKLNVPHVLLSVALEEDQSLDLDSLDPLDQRHSALAKYVLVEGVFRSHSTMVLLSLPVPIWDVLQDDRAVSFVGYVESRNRLIPASEEANIRIKELVSSLETAQARVESLELVNNTWQQRIENESKHAGKQYQALQERFDSLQETLEATLNELNNPSERGTTKQQKTNRRSNPPNPLVRVNRPVRPISSVSMTSIPKATLVSSTHSTFRRRVSELSLPVRPSTPLKPTPMRLKSETPTRNTRNSTAGSQSTATTASTMFSDVGGWSSTGDLPNRNPGHRSESDNSSPTDPVIEQTTESKTKRSPQ